MSKLWTRKYTHISQVLSERVCSCFSSFKLQEKYIYSSEQYLSACGAFISLSSSLKISASAYERWWHMHMCDLHICIFVHFMLITGCKGKCWIHTIKVYYAVLDSFLLSCFTASLLWLLMDSRKFTHMEKKKKKTLIFQMFMFSHISLIRLFVPAMNYFKAFIIWTHSDT